MEEFFIKYILSSSGILTIFYGNFDFTCGGRIAAAAPGDAELGQVRALLQLHVRRALATAAQHSHAAHAAALMLTHTGHLTIYI